MLREIVLLAVQTVWFFLPALLANMAPVFAAKVRPLDFLDIALDGGRKLRGKRLLGDNKTVRGLVAGVVIGLITGFFQALFLPGLGNISWEVLTPGALLGALLGFGALLGDALKSFVKRQLDMAPGKSWVPFDQIDMVIGVLLVTWWWIDYAWLEIVVAFIVVGTLSYITSFIGVQLKIKKSI